MNDQPLPTKEDATELPAAALDAAAGIARAFFEANGEPPHLLLDEKQLTRVLAFAVDGTVKAAGRAWK